MPEIKHQFTKGKMNKDLDERLVPNGEYRDAMNVQVSSSEGSDVGTVQNILGNKLIDIDGFNISNSLFDAVTIGAIADEKIDTLYYLVYGTEADYIISYKRGDQSPEPVLVDKNKNVLNFNTGMSITGINVIDDMLFFTDNKNEPKKINITRCKAGTNGNWTQHTKLINESQGIDINSNIDIEEKHITVIKKSPKFPLSVDMITGRPPSDTNGNRLIYTGVVTISVDTFVPNSFVDPNFYDFSEFSLEEGANTFDINITEALNSQGALISIGNVGSIDGLTGWHKPQPDYSNSTTERGNILAGTKVVLKPFDLDGTPPGLPVTDFVMKGVVEDIYDTDDRTTGATRVRIKLTTIDGFPPLVPDGFQEFKYVIDLFEEEEKLFEFKFPRFSYRYKYEDGEYSSFAPFTQVIFSPGSFDYHPRKGFNLGMTNRLSKVVLKNVVTEQIEEDVVAVDILFKDETSPVIYVVETIGADDAPSVFGASENLWDKISNFLDGNGYEISKETINAVVPSNQLLRLYDNVPRKALAQEVIGSRLVYGNYIQNYTLVNQADQKYNPGDFNVSWTEFLPTEIESATSTIRSIKSLREYQVGVIFIDKYGRETPVISNSSSALRLEKDRADRNNRLSVKLGGNDNRPKDLSYMKFYVKETAGEYYNMALDRFYDAEDGNIWLAFASADRNKVDIDSFLILKKGADQDNLVKAQARYKVIAIANEAPNFIKTQKKLASEEYHFEASQSKNVFGSGLTGLHPDGNAPTQGLDEFVIKYKPFFGGPGGGLANYRDGKLWVSFCLLGSNEESERYRVTSIHTDFDPAGGLNSTGIDEALYFIKLDRNLGADVNFISDDNTGAAPTEIVDGAGIKFYKYEIEDLSRFDGRFFVKIYSDEVFKNNIGKSFKDGLPFRRIASKKVFLMDKLDHLRLVGPDLGTDNSGNVGDEAYYFTDGHVAKSYSTSLGGAIFNDYPSSTKVWFEDGTNNVKGSVEMSPEDYTWGYYSIPDYLNFALYFRRFIKSNHSPIAYNSIDATILDDRGFVRQFKETRAPYLKTVELGSRGEKVWSSDPYDIFQIEYKNRFWREIFHWRSEMGTKTTGGMVAGFSTGYQGNVSVVGSPGDIQLRVQHLGISESANTVYRQVDSQVLSDPEDRTSAALDAGVFFIDRGPYVARRSSAHNLYWRWNWLIGGDATYAGITANWINRGPRFSNGLRINSDGDSWSMELAYGGIIGAADRTGTHDVEGFFNIADWQTPGGAVNPNHDDQAFTTFINELDFGTQFRWKEDPTRTVYTIGSIDGQNTMKVRHSPGGDCDGLSNKNVGYGGTFGNKTSGSWEGNTGGIDGTFYGDVDRYHPVANPLSMAEELSYNYTRGFDIKTIRPILQWNPITKGQIDDGLQITLKACDENGNTSGNGKTSQGIDYNDDLIIFVKSLQGANAGPSPDGNPNAIIHEGMALKSYTNANSVSDELQASTHLTSSAQEYLIVRFIETVNEDDAENKFFRLHLGGYTKCLNVNLEYKISAQRSSNRCPKINGDLVFVQVGMNSFSPNTEFNVNTTGKTHGKFGAIGAVGYTFEVVQPIEPEEVITENPAVFETEPKDIKELDIYYEASAAVPYSFNKENVHEAFPIGSYISVFNESGQARYYTVIGYRNENIYIDKDPQYGGSREINPGDDVNIIRPDGLEISIKIDGVDQSGPGGVIPNGHYLEVRNTLYRSKYQLPYHNCFSFGNGVESNRIRDNFNLPFITNGVRVSTTLETGYEEEHRQYGLIYSGIYNSISGVNNLNQFIAGEKITKDINPIYGSIQKLHARDTDLVTLCEDKVLKILANKDAVFNADGDTNLTATENVLGQTIPFRGEYGISTNPESFASEAYRAYFTDKVRGAVMRLSVDGLTAISDQGMKDWFRDNLKLSTKLKGSYDDRKDEYNILIEKYYLKNFTLVNDSKILTYKESVKGWVSFKSFIDATFAVSMGNDYYTFYTGKLYKHHVEDVPRNTFYGFYTNSSVDVLLNDDPGSTKIFSTLNYEGSQSKVDKFVSELRHVGDPYQPDTVYNDQEFYNLSDKKGWNVESIITDKENGYISEFLEKESKWFNYINKQIDLDLTQADTSDFSFQGIGQVTSVQDDAAVSDDDIILTDFDTGFSTGTSTDDIIVTDPVDPIDTTDEDIILVDPIDPVDPREPRTDRDIVTKDDIIIVTNRDNQDLIIVDDAKTEETQEQEVEIVDVKTKEDEILTYIDGIPLYKTVEQALDYAKRNNLLGYHTHVFEGVTGYMGGVDHKNAVTGETTKQVTEQVVETTEVIETRETTETRETRETETSIREVAPTISESEAPSPSVEAPAVRTRRTRGTRY